MSLSEGIAEALSVILRLDTGRQTGRIVGTGFGKQEGHKKEGKE